VALPMMNSFNETMAAFFMQAMPDEGFPFYQFNFY